MNAGTRILVVGDVMTDVIVVPEGPIVTGSDRRATVRSRPGGSGANQAVWLGFLGAPVRFAARVGDADLSMYENYFRGFGVAPYLAGDAVLPSGVLVTILDPSGERSFLTDRGANLNLSAEDLPDDLLEDVGVLVVSGYSFFEPGPRAAVRRLMGAARQAGVNVAVDPSSIGFLAEVGREPFLDWVDGAGLLLANRDEAALLCGSDGIDEQMERLGRHFETVVIKRGAEGAALGGAEGTRHFVPAPAVTAIDSTGAGDAFAAGFLKARLSGAGEADALRQGVEAGSRAVQFLGGQPH